MELLKKARAISQPPPVATLLHLGKSERTEEKTSPREPTKPPPLPPLLPTIVNTNRSAAQKENVNDKPSATSHKTTYMWDSDNEELPSVFHAWIKVGIPENSLRASEWGAFTAQDREVAIRVAPSGEGPLMLIEEEGNILFKSEPRLLREVTDSTRYFSLKVPRSQLYPKDFYVGIAFNDRKDSAKFVKKLWSVLRGVTTPKNSEGEKEEDKLSFWLFMSDEIIFNIFKFLPPKDLCTLSLVCSRWNLIANDKFLWKELCIKNQFIPDEYDLKYKYHKSYKLCYIQNWRLMHPPKVGAHAPDLEDLEKYAQSIEFHGTTGLKLVCVGSCGSEKTKLLLAYAQKGNLPHTQEYIPTVFDNYTLHLNSDSLPYLAEDSAIELSLWDTAGQDDYDRLRPLSYANASVFLVLFSLVNPASFDNVRTKWYPEIKHFCPDVPILLVGVHAELRSDATTLRNLQAAGQSPISTSDALREASYLMLDHYIECSIPSRENIDKVFELAVYSVLIRQQRKQKDKSKCLVC